MRAYIKDKRIVVDVLTINFEAGYLTWWDGQYDRCNPPDKLYEMETFDNVELICPLIPGRGGRSGKCKQKDKKKHNRGKVWGQGRKEKAQSFKRE